MDEQKNKEDILDALAPDLLSQRIEWRRKGWSIPELKGGKQAWFSLIKELVELMGEGQASELEAIPNLQSISVPQSWRSYGSFLKGIGLAENQAGILCLSEEGVEFRRKPTKRHLANLIQERIRLFGETLAILEESPATVEEVDRQLCESYKLGWANLSNTRKRMDWLEVLGLIEGVGNRKWKVTTAGQDVLKEWILITPKALEPLDLDSGQIRIAAPPSEIADLLQRLIDSPELHKKRSTYNIWVPSPNRIENLRTITQMATERIGRADFLRFIEEKFNLKPSSVESMMPFLKVSGLIEEVGRNIYLATPAAKAWLENGNDFDFIRILHSHMQFVGEMIRAARTDTVRNDIYEQAKVYGLNAEKARWIAGFLLEAGLLEEPQYLHLKATPMGLSFVSELPLAEPDEKVNNADEMAPEELKTVAPAGEFERCKAYCCMLPEFLTLKGKRQGRPWKRPSQMFFDLWDLKWNGLVALGIRMWW